MPDGLVPEVALAVELLEQVHADQEAQPTGAPFLFHREGDVIDATDDGLRRDEGSGGTRPGLRRAEGAGVRSSWHVSGAGSPTFIDEVFVAFSTP